VSQTTSIEWTDVSWNPVHGCSKVSPGCAHCYAETLSRRYKQTPAPWTPANAPENVILKPHKLNEPLKWKAPRMVFVNSMSDLFHELVPDEYIARVFAVMAAAPQHTFQVLTKRPERMREWFAWEGPGINRCGTVRNRFDWHYAADRDPMARLFPWPLPNVWLGVSIENRRFVHRADVLRDTPAAVRFISAEPLLGSLVSFAAYDGPPINLTGIDWLIAGGESGQHHRRRLDIEWVRQLRDECAASGTAFFVKQIGGARPGTKLEDLPEDLRIREFPNAVIA
jgi:protein gp37